MWQAELRAAVEEQELREQHAALIRLLMHVPLLSHPARHGPAGRPAGLKHPDLALPCAATIEERAALGRVRCRVRRGVLAALAAARLAVEVPKIDREVREVATVAAAVLLPGDGPRLAQA